MKISVIGVYPIEEALEPCHLVEIRVEAFQGKLNLAEFTQEVEGTRRDTWQSPWDEYVLNSDGTSGQIASSGLLDIDGTQRLTFFFHYLDGNRPLTTPVGFIELPKATSYPSRLAFVKYEAPD